MVRRWRNYWHCEPRAGIDGAFNAEQTPRPNSGCLRRSRLTEGIREISGSGAPAKDPSTSSLIPANRGVKPVKLAAGANAPMVQTRPMGRSETLES
jgi:hypothetical protein